jgi:hypothetical protein
LNKASIQRTLNTLPDGAKVVLDAQNTLRIHPDVVEIVEEFQINAATRDITVECLGFGSTISETPVEDFEEKVLQKTRAKATGVRKLFKGK